jgi:hypothetical protein
MLYEQTCVHIKISLILRQCYLGIFYPSSNSKVAGSKLGRQLSPYNITEWTITIYIQRDKINVNLYYSISLTINKINISTLYYHDKIHLTSRFPPLTCGYSYSTILNRIFPTKHWLPVGGAVSPPPHVVSYAYDFNQYVFTVDRSRYIITIVKRAFLTALLITFQILPRFWYWHIGFRAIFLVTGGTFTKSCSYIR